jgi:hypothetical protein
MIILQWFSTLDGNILAEVKIPFGLGKALPAREAVQ